MVCGVTAAVEAVAVTAGAGAGTLAEVGASGGFALDEVAAPCSAGALDCGSAEQPANSSTATTASTGRRII